MRIAGWKGSGHDPSSVPLSGWALGVCRRVQEGEHLKLLLTAAFDDSPAWLSLSSHALLCFEGTQSVSFCVQCKNWWKCVFFLLLLLVLCQHHLSWSPTVSLSLPSVLMWISSSITYDSSKCSPCADWDFCPQHRSAHLSFETGPALFSSAAPLSLEHIPYCTGFNFHLVTYLSENFKWAWSLNLVRVFLLIFYTVSCVRKYSDIIIGRLFLRQSGCQDFFFFPPINAMLILSSELVSPSMCFFM